MPDEEKPRCDRCSRGGHHCEGYESKTRWIDKTTSPVDPGPKPSNSTNPPIIFQFVSEGSALSLPASPYPRTPSPLTLDASIDFTVKQLCGDDPLSLAWSDAITQGKQTDVSYLAFNCLASAYFGTMQKCVDAVDRGSILYNKALRQLKISIVNPDTAYDHQNIAATMALAYYELVVNTHEAGWIQHVGGTGRLLEVRGPQRCQNEPVLTYFLLSRFKLIMRGVHQRKRIFLDSDDWLSIPWAGAAKSSQDAMLDIACVVPSLLEDFDSLCQGGWRLTTEQISRLWQMNTAASGVEVPAWAALRVKVISTLQHLVRWRSSWEKKHARFVSERSTNAITSIVWDCTESDWPRTSLIFGNLNHALDILYYHLVLNTITYLAPFLRQRPVIPNPSDRPQNSTSPLSQPILDPTGACLVFPSVEDSIEEFRRSLDYLLLENHRGVTAFAVIMGLFAW